MAACAWCLHVFHAERCTSPLSDQCRLERRLEDMAHAINWQISNDHQNTSPGPRKCQ